MESEKDIDVFIALFTGTLIMFAMAAGIVLFLGAYRRKMKEQRKSLMDMQQKIQLDLFGKNIAAMETERKRFATDLHDEVGSKLSALKLSLTHIERKADDGLAVNQVVQKSKDMLDMIIEVTRRISHNIMPPSLDAFGLETAIGDLCDWITDSSGMTVELETDIDAALSNRNMELGLYRVLQELLSNSIKHSSAKKVCISIKIKKENTRILYNDDGHGFDRNTIEPGSGMGIKNIEDRLALLHLSIQYVSQPANGFACVISGPVK
jgi:signal transduction histidine kinase